MKGCVNTQKAFSAGQFCKSLLFIETVFLFMHPRGVLSGMESVKKHLADAASGSFGRISKDLL